MSHHIVEGKKNRYCSKCGKEDFSDQCRYADRIEQDKIKLEEEKVKIEVNTIKLEEETVKIQKDKLKLEDKQINYNLLGSKYIFILFNSICISTLIGKIFFATF